MANTSRPPGANIQEINSLEKAPGISIGSNIQKNFSFAILLGASTRKTGLLQKANTNIRLHYIATKTTTATSTANKEPWSTRSLCNEAPLPFAVLEPPWLNPVDVEFELVLVEDEELKLGFDWAEPPDPDPPFWPGMLSELSEAEEEAAVPDADDVELPAVMLVPVASNELKMVELPVISTVLLVAATSV